MSTASLLSGKTHGGVRDRRAHRRALLRGLAAQIRFLELHPQHFETRGKVGALLAKLQRIARNPRTSGAHKSAAFDKAGGAA